MTAAPAVASRRFPALETAALAVFALALAWQTIVPPPVGLADNGDFARIAGPMGLRATASPEPPHRYFGFLLPGFQITSPWWRSRYGTSELVPIGLARTIGKVFSKTGFVDIRVIGAANALFVLVGAAVLLAGTRRWRARSRILFAFLVVGIYSDAAYATPLNSLFSQTASLWAFLLLAGFALSALDRPTPAALCGYWIAALLFVTAKPQEIVQVPAIALFGVLLTKAGPAPVSRGARPWALAAALFAAAVVYYLRIPPTISGPGLHNQVFVEILGQSPDPAADLRDLGLPAEWAAYRGVNP
ncbi:MAG TPA: hypothetical protein VFL12_06990, partial [Thermoanaerobaculia bacterium]|nr:hypothetical protein [Thermoanaerobaculia bacterium]